MMEKQVPRGGVVPNCCGCYCLRFLLVLLICICIFYYKFNKNILFLKKGGSNEQNCDQMQECYYFSDCSGRRNSCWTYHSSMDVICSKSAKHCTKRKAPSIDMLLWSSLESMKETQVCSRRKLLYRKFSDQKLVVLRPQMLLQGPWSRLAEFSTKALLLVAGDSLGGGMFPLGPAGMMGVVVQKHLGTH